MTEARPPRIEPAKMLFAVWRSSAAAGLALAVVVLGCAVLFGEGTALARTLVAAVACCVVPALAATFLVLRLDLWPMLRRLVGATLREEATATAQQAALAVRLASYGARLSRVLVPVHLVLFLLSLSGAILLSGAPWSHLAPLLPCAVLSAPVVAAVARFAARRTLGPYLVGLPRPTSSAAFRGSLATGVSVMLVFPAAVAALVGVVYGPLASAAEHEQEWRRSRERLAAALVGSADAWAALAPATTAPRGAGGAGRIAECGSRASGWEAGVCDALADLRFAEASSWVSAGGDWGWAAAPRRSPGGSVGAVVVWGPLPIPPGLPPWLLGGLALVLIAAHLAGAAGGRRIGRELAVLADAIARADAAPAPVALSDRGSPVREIARLQVAVADLAGQLAEMRRDEEHALCALQETYRVRTHFLASVSHDLKGPLNAILGFSELLLRGVEGPLSPAQREDVRLIHRSGDELLTIINSILDSAKLEAGRIEMHREWTPSVELISEAAAHARELVGGKNLAVEVQTQAGLPPLHVDPHRLQQAIRALVSNAVKFSETGTVKLRAWAERGPEGAGVFRLDVADEGPGISEEDRSRIFHAFEQLDTSVRRTAGGTGLGLFIAKQLVELHGGRLWFDSVVGRGSVFSIAVPLPREEPGGSVQERSGRRSSDGR
ncbi:MAG: HAMP domain-containing histidine kinase [Deltaproteobacteria bacterium]|nr:HAMP domain-containing histidine kinase [Deltaproteobacteria bacterium]